MCWGVCCGAMGRFFLLRMCQLAVAAAAQRPKSSPSSVCLSLLFAHLVDYATVTSKREREKRKGVRRGAAAAQMEKGKKGKKRVRK